MQTEPLMQFKSHVAGKNADVAIYADRIEWSQHGLVKGGMLGRSKGSDIIPISQVSSISTKKDGLRFTAVHVITSGNTVDFRVGHNEAEGIKATLTQLLLGTHPGQQTTTPPPAPPGGSPAPPAPGTPAGWIQDPHGRHELRYWDGGRWTEHVSSGGAQAVDPA